MASISQMSRDRNIEFMHLRDVRNPSIRESLLERFWPPEEWPNHVINCLINFKYTDRICVTNFFFGNGLQFEQAFNLICFYHDWNFSATNQYRRTFRGTWTRIEQAVKRQHENWADIVSNYYFYSMFTKSVLYFDGSIRLYGVKINVQQNINISRRVTVPHSNEEFELSQESLVQQRHLYDQRDRAQRLERRWLFLASIDNDPIIIDGYVFRFDHKLYTNVID